MVNEPQIFHDESRPSILRPLDRRGRETADQRGALSRSDSEETGVPEGREGVGIAFRQHVTEGLKGAVGIHTDPARPRIGLDFFDGNTDLVASVTAENFDVIGVAGGEYPTPQPLIITASALTGCLGDFPGNRESDSL